MLAPNKKFENDAENACLNKALSGSLMFRVFYEEKLLAESALESGDPPMGCVSGLLCNIDDIQSFSDLLLRLGGAVTNGEYRLELDSRFSIVNSDGKPLEYSVGQMMSYPELDETVIEIVGIPYPEYGDIFPDHVKAYENQFRNT